LISIVVIARESAQGATLRYSSNSLLAGNSAGNLFETGAESTILARVDAVFSVTCGKFPAVVEQGIFLTRAGIFARRVREIFG
jgi:hypothetical protein